MKKLLPETLAFPMRVPPVNEGVYKVVRPISIFTTEIFSLWDGDEWKVVRGRPSQAAIEHDRSVHCYDGTAIGWIGLTERAE